MELKEAIESRRSIRHYKEDKLTKEKITDLLEMAILSPSAKNKQPWHFIVVNEDQELKNKIANILKDKTNEEPTLTCEVIKSCSTLILVYGDIENEIYDISSVGASIENLILAATSENIGTLWIGYILKIEKELKEIFNHNGKLIAGIALGTSACSPKPRPRKSLEEVSTWY